MPTLTIKGLPDPIYERLKAQAEAHRRSLNSEIITCLERAVAAPPLDVEPFLAKLETFSQGLRVTPLTDKELRAARERGRA